MSGRAEFLRRLGHDPANPTANPRGPGDPLPIPQAPTFNTSYGYSTMPQFTGPFATVPPGTVAPQVPAPTTGLLVPGTITNLFNRMMILDPRQDRAETHTAITSSFTDKDPHSPFFGKEVLVPTVVGGKLLSNREAMDHYYRTREHLGIFDNWQNADAYAAWLHNEQTRRAGGPP
jgi:hypothetical protein